MLSRFTHRTQAHRSSGATFLSKSSPTCPAAIISWWFIWGRSRLVVTFNWSWGRRSMAFGAPRCMTIWPCVLSTWPIGRSWRMPLPTGLPAWTWAVVHSARRPRPLKANGAVSHQPVYQQVTGIRKPTEGATVVTQAQTDGGFRTFRRLWPKLPFPVAQFLGPKVRRHIPFCLVRGARSHAQCGNQGRTLCVLASSA